MKAFLLPNGNMLVPLRAEGPGGIIGDGLIEVGPSNPEFDAWLKWAVEAPQEMLKTNG
jgi:hypothetical protein